MRSVVSVCLCVSVRLSVCPFRALTFVSIDLETWYAGTSSEYLGQLLHGGHRVKVKVTETKERVCVSCSGFNF